MLTRIANKIDALGFVMKMTKSITLLFALIFSLTLSAKIKDVASKLSSDICITDGVIIFESDDLQKTGEGEVNENSSESQKAKVFVSEGVVIYNSDALSNVTIVELEKVKKVTQKTKKQVSKKTIATKPKYKSQNQLAVDFYYTSQQSSEKYLQNQKDRVVVSPCRVQTFAKAVTSSAYLITNFLYLSKIQEIIYTNPSVKIFHFSGKYSVRPPTFFQI